MKFTIPITATIHATDARHAVLLAQKAEQLLNQEFTKMMIKSQGVPLESVKVGAPVALP